LAIQRLEIWSNGTSAFSRVSGYFRAAALKSAGIRGGSLAIDDNGDESSHGGNVVHSLIPNLGEVF
jgi:hypothetical protein